MSYCYAGDSEPIDADVVSLAALHLAATIGPDHWHRTRPQPVQLSLQLHLAPFYLDASGRSDDVRHSLHYGHLAKAVGKRVGTRAEKGYASVRALAEDVTDAAFTFVRDATKTGMDADTDAEGLARVVHTVRVVLSLPKRILLAGDFQLELTTRASDWIACRSGVGAIVRVVDLVLPVLVGVNPPERLTKQRIVVDLTFFEAGAGEVDYPAIVEEIVTDVEHSAHLTLEKLVFEIIQTAHRTSNTCTDLNSNVSPSRIDAITVRCRKPSALSFADASGIEMTRTWRTMG